MPLKGLVLAHVPEQLKAGPRMAVRLRERAHFRGDSVACPCCGVSFREFIPFNGRPAARCAWCGSLERHRLLAIYLANKGYVRPGAEVLHFAPEQALKRVLRRNATSYLSVDLNSSAADLSVDITDLPFAEATFDLVVCSHVLEHVADDARAMSELCRVLQDDGRLIVMCPIEAGRTTTVEDPSVTTPAQRLVVFGQEDHVRIYGLDITDRLEQAGLEVAPRRVEEIASTSEAEKYGLWRHDRWGPDVVYDCQKRASRVVRSPIGPPDAR